MNVYKIIENEVNQYLTGKTPISEGHVFSQYQLIKRLAIYANKIYPKGKLQKGTGYYKYWIDITTTRRDSEVKNIDFDTKDINFVSDIEKDAGAMILLNLSLAEWLKKTKQSVELNAAIEEATGWGNVVWKKIKGGYKRVDLKNFYVVNQAAETLDDTPVNERHNLNQSQLRAKADVWNNVDEVIKTCGNKSFTKLPSGISESKETKYYEIFERNGEISEHDLFEAQGKTGGDESKYLLAKIICAGLSEKGGDSEKYVLFAEDMSEMPYREYHRGSYHGRWWREGIIELLFDIQTRANEISNQLARGLEWASKTIFSGTDKLIASNIITDLNSGDYIRSKDIKQLEVRMQGIDQLIADWNRLMEVADKLCNSYEVVTGESLPSGTPFRLASMINQNANKLFDFLREKLSIALESVYQDWVLPEIMRDLKKKDVLRLTGDSDKMNEYLDLIVNAWYVKNLAILPPHTPEEGTALKLAKLEEIKANKDQYIKLEKGWLDGIKPRVSVVISGENVSLQKDLETLNTFIALEQDPIRRTALIERAMKKTGMDISGLPKTEALQEPVPAQQTAPVAEAVPV